MGYLGFARLWWGEQQRGVNEPPHCKAARTSYTLQRRHFLRVCTTYFPIEYIAVKVGLCGDSFIIIPVVDTATSHDAGFRHDEPPCTSCVNITSADYPAAERRMCLSVRVYQRVVTTVITPIPSSKCGACCLHRQSTRKRLGVLR